jgi:hypothetical protein
LTRPPPSSPNGFDKGGIPVLKADFYVLLGGFLAVSLRASGIGGGTVMWDSGLSKISPCVA